MRSFRAAASLLMAAVMLLSPAVYGLDRTETATAPDTADLLTAEPARPAEGYEEDASDAAGTLPETAPAKAVLVSEKNNGSIVCELEGPAFEQQAEEPLPEPADDRSGEKEKERQFIARDPKLSAMAAVIPEGSDVPVSECDAGFHKYVASLMRQQGMSVALNNLCVPLMLNSVTVSGADALIHQDRFASCIKSYGTDVSEFQGNIDWKKVKAAGIDFAILRAGYRGYGKAGTLVLDPKFLSNLQNAKAAGLKVGVYFFTQAITVAEAKAEADFVYKYIKGTSLELPVYCDMEEIWYDTGRLDSANLSMAQKTAIIEAFCDRMRELGYESGVYSNPSWMTYYLDRAKLEAKYPIWLANYTTKTNYQYKFNIWQYGTGNIDGISGLTDMDVKYDAAKPEKPTGLTCTQATDTSLTFKWDEPSVAVQTYQLYRYNSSNSSYTIMGTTNTCSITITGCEPGSKEYYTLRAMNKIDGKDYISDFSRIIAASTFCAAPKDLKAEVQGRSLTLSWTPHEATEVYLIFSGRSSAQPVCIGMTSSSSYTYLPENGVYEVFVRACCRAGGAFDREADSEHLNVSVGSIKAEARIKSVGRNSITLAWNAAVPAEKCRIFSVDEKTGAEKLIAECAPSDGEYTVNDLKLAERYAFRVETAYTGRLTELSDILAGVTRSGIAGDLNGDSKVDMLDICLLRGYLKNGTSIDLTIADVNCDKQVNDKDLEMFTRMIAGSGERMV